MNRLRSGRAERKGQDEISPYLERAGLPCAVADRRLRRARDGLPRHRNRRQGDSRENCSRCHSIEATGESPLKGAPPLRVIYLKYPVEQLEYDFAEGMGSRHREMPQIQFSSEEVSAILNYLGSITGRPPSQRLPAAIPGETEPP
jgi:cytochrome c553